MITLVPMTREMCHEFYREFQNDPAIYMDMSRFSEFVYTPEWVDRYFDRQQVESRRLFVIMAGDCPVGEVKLHHIDWETRECTLGIHMRNDSVKGKGYGTRAEQLVVQYAFDELGMEAVNADAVLKNTRSQYVLEKVGFQFLREDETYKYYRIKKAKK